MKIYPTAKIAWQTYRDVVYVFNEETKKVYLFSGTAKDFWTTIMNHCDTFTAVHSLCLTYGQTNQEIITEDIQDFISNLIQVGVLQKEECDG